MPSILGSTNLDIVDRRTERQGTTRKAACCGGRGCRKRTGLTWTAVELVRLRDVAATELDALTDLRSDGRARIAARRDRVEVRGTGERVASVVHDAVEVVRFAQRVHLGRRQSVEVVLLPCNHPTTTNNL